MLSRCLAFLGVVVGDNTGDLDNADETEEEVDGCEQDVSRLDDQAPTSPDQAGTCESNILCEGELFSRTIKVSDACNNERPLHDGSPEMHSLEANRTIPHPLKPAPLRSGRSGTLPSLAAIVLESASRRSEQLRLCLLRSKELLRAEGRARGAEEG